MGALVCHPLCGRKQPDSVRPQICPWAAWAWAIMVCSDSSLLIGCVPSKLCNTYIVELGEHGFVLPACGSSTNSCPEISSSPSSPTALQRPLSPSHPVATGSSLRILPTESLSADSKSSHAPLSNPLQSLPRCSEHPGYHM